MRQIVPTYGLYGEENAGFADFWIHSESIPARSRLHNWEIQLHRHDAFFQILDIRGGEGVLLGKGGEVSLCSGSLVTVPPGLTHGFRFSSDIDGHVLTFLASRLPGLGLADTVVQKKLLVTILDGGGKDIDLARDLIARVNEEVASGFGIGSEFVQACLVAALNLVARSGETNATSEPGPERDRVRFNRLKDLVALHFREHRPVEHYAQKLAVTPTHLNRIVRRLTGGPVTRLINERVVEEARRDLVFTSMTVQQIAYELGFSDPAYFNRFFSRQIGTTPQAYRRAERKRLEVSE